jgi:deazaflavin-dependent oxidoreductase (nitroreductase family)
MSMGSQIKDRVRVFNKHILNPIMGKLSGARRGPFALVRHVGRRSGKPYQTPILVVPVADGFVIALTYGPKVDWYRNVVAADGCRIVWHAREYVIAGVEPLDADSGRAHFPPPENTILRLLGIAHYAKLKFAVGEEPAGDPAT